MSNLISITANGDLVCKVTAGEGRIKVAVSYPLSGDRRTASWYWQADPRCGLDIADDTRAYVEMQALFDQMKAPPK